jgi:predicted aconitase with swiveling domain
LSGKPMVAGEAHGLVVASREPLSFWGGYDYYTGEIIDRRHPLSGQRVGGCILALPFTRGSSTTTAVLLEAVKAGTAPAAILTNQPDAFFALASIVADELYRTPFPLVVLDEEDFSALHSGMQAVVELDGQVILLEQEFGPKRS